MARSSRGWAWKGQGRTRGCRGCPGTHSNCPGVQIPSRCPRAPPAIPCWGLKFREFALIHIYNIFFYVTSPPGNFSALNSSFKPSWKKRHLRGGVGVAVSPQRAQAGAPSFPQGPSLFPGKSRAAPKGSFSQHSRHCQVILSPARLTDPALESQSRLQKGGGNELLPFIVADRSRCPARGLSANKQHLVISSGFSSLWRRVVLGGTLHGGSGAGEFRDPRSQRGRNDVTAEGRDS